MAAGLDVTDPEPMPVDEPLLSLPNCIVVPAHRVRVEGDAREDGRDGGREPAGRRSRRAAADTGQPGGLRPPLILGKTRSWLAEARPVGIGIVGAGLMARTYAYAIGELLPEARLVAVTGAVAGRAAGARE